MLCKAVLPILALLACGSVSAQSSSSSSQPEEDGSNAEVALAAQQRAPVSFRGRQLFEISAPIGTLTVSQRALAIEQRILLASSQPADVLDAIRVVERHGLSEIYVGDVLIRSVTDRDAFRTGRTRRQLAADHELIVREALREEFRDKTAAALLRSVAISVAATAAMLALLYGIRRSYRWGRSRLARLAQDWHEESRLARLRLISPAAIFGLSRSIVAASAWLIVLIAFYFYVEFVLSLFPWTKGIAQSMVDATRAAVVRVGRGAYDYLPSMVNIIVIVFVARLILKVVKSVFDSIAAQRMVFGSFYPEWASPTYSLLRFLVIAVAAVMIFPYLPGSGSAGFKGISVFIGLLVSLGAASAIANVIAGIVLTYMRPFRSGDRVKIADAIGDVTGKDLFVVRLRTIKNVDITIPNSLVLANHIINFSSSAQNEGLILHTKVTIGYDAPWPRVHELLLEAASRVEGIEREPKPFVLQTSLDDFSVAYELNAYTRQPSRMAAIYSHLHAEIQNSFNAAGVEILSPTYSAVRDGNRITLPEEYLPKDYRTPTFNIAPISRQPRQTS